MDGDGTVFVTFYFTHFLKGLSDGTDFKKNVEEE